MYRWWLFLLGGALVGLAYIMIQRERERYWLLQQKAQMLEYDYGMIKEGNQEKKMIEGKGIEPTYLVKNIDSYKKLEEIITLCREVSNVEKRNAAIMQDSV